MAPSRPFEINPFRNGNQTKAFSPLIQVSKKRHIWQISIWQFFQINITSRVFKLEFRSTTQIKDCLKLFKNV